MQVFDALPRLVREEGLGIFDGLPAIYCKQVRDKERERWWMHSGDILQAGMRERRGRAGGREERQQADSRQHTDRDDGCLAAIYCEQVGQKERESDGGREEKQAGRQAGRLTD